MPMWKAAMRKPSSFGTGNSKTILPAAVEMYIEKAKNRLLETSWKSRAGPKTLDVELDACINSLYFLSVWEMEKAIATWEKILALTPRTAMPGSAQGAKLRKELM